jgi:hypothetical protein
MTLPKVMGDRFAIAVVTAKPHILGRIMRPG